MIQARASARYVRVSPMKARRVVDLVRGKSAQDAVTILRFAPQAASRPVRKVVESAMANLRVKTEREGGDYNEVDLVVAQAYVDEGPTLKRFRARARGQGSRILKRTSHITVVVEQLDNKKGRTR